MSIISSGLQSRPNFIQLFTAVIYGFAYKARGFVLVSPFETSLAYPRVEHLKGAWVHSSLAHEHLTRSERLARYKQSSLLQKITLYGLKSFITFG